MDTLLAAARSTRALCLNLQDSSPSMETDPIAKLKQRDTAMRAARDEILTRVGAWLRSKDFDPASTGHFTRSRNGRVWHIGFQKHTSGRSVRVMCHVTSGTDAKTLASGPWSDAYERSDCQTERNTISAGVRERPTSQDALTSIAGILTTSYSLGSMIMRTRQRDSQAMNGSRR